MVLRSNEMKVFNLAISNLCTSDLFKLTGTVFNLSLSNLSTSSFQPAKSISLASFDAATPAALLTSDVFNMLERFNSIFIFPSKWLNSLREYWTIFIKYH